MIYVCAVCGELYESDDREKTSSVPVYSYRSGEETVINSISNQEGVLRLCGKCTKMAIICASFSDRDVFRVTGVYETNNETN